MKILITKTTDKVTNTSPKIIYDDNHDNEFNVLFVGDTSFADSYISEYVSRERICNIYHMYGYDYSFQNIKSILLDSDLTVANLETPLVDIANTPRPSFSFSDLNRFNQKQGRYQHWSDVKIAPIYFKKYNLTNLSLANNHMLDYGMEGFKQTLESLYEHEIRFFGAGYDRKQADRPYIKNLVVGNRTLKLVVISAFEYRKGYDEDFSFYAGSSRGGVNPLSIKRIAKKIQKIRKKNANNVFIVAYPHWGGRRNYGWKTVTQTKLGHRIVDAGADIVIGTGPHNLQQIEKYRGKWIIYSIGNFMYNTLGNYGKYNAAPFSLVVKLIFKDQSNFATTRAEHSSINQIKRHMKIYPIVTDNTITYFQARFVDQKEFEAVCKLLIDEKYGWNLYENDVKLGSDQIGRFIEFPL
jgi:Bacterial capsule synthesis protein PGA_cap